MLCALQIESGRTIEIERSHAMENSPEFVQHCINIGREGSFRDEPRLKNIFIRPEASPGGAADFLPVDHYAVHPIHQPVELRLFEHERPIPLHHDDNGSVMLLRKLSGEFLRKRKLAFNGKLRQDFLLVLEVLVE